MSDDPLAQAMPLCGTLGIRLVEASKERVILELDHAPELCTTGSVMHGGALMTLADSAGAMAAFLNLPEGATGTATISSTTNFLAAVKQGTARATATPVKVGGRVITVRTEIVNGERHVASVIQTQVVS